MTLVTKQTATSLQFKSYHRKTAHGKAKNVVCIRVLAFKGHNYNKPELVPTVLSELGVLLLELMKMTSEIIKRRGVRGTVFI